MNFSDLYAAVHPYEWLAILVARLALGVLFMLSGRKKLFTQRGREEIRREMNEAGVLPGFNAVFVPIVELTSGSLLVQVLMKDTVSAPASPLMSYAMSKTTAGLSTGGCVL